MLNENLKNARIAAGLTQQQVADILGVDRSAYTYYETGKSDVSTKRLLLLSALFGVSVNELLSATPILGFHCDNPLIKPKSEDMPEEPLSIMSVSLEDRALLAKIRLIRGLGKGREFDEFLDSLCQSTEE